MAAPRLAAAHVRGFPPVLPGPAGEKEEEIFDLLISEILSLNGKQSIFQMSRFYEGVRSAAGPAPRRRSCCANTSAASTP